MSHLLVDMYSILQVDFHLRRSTGFFLINVYVPCSLLVILSWVGFWINREATSDRIALGEPDYQNFGYSIEKLYIIV